MMIHATAGRLVPCRRRVRTGKARPWQLFLRFPSNFCFLFSGAPSLTLSHEIPQVWALMRLTQYRRLHPILAFRCLAYYVVGMLFSAARRVTGRLFELLLLGQHHTTR